MSGDSSHHLWALACPQGANRVTEFIPEIHSFTCPSDNGVKNGHIGVRLHRIREGELPFQPTCMHFLYTLNKLFVGNFGLLLPRG
ncbi:unnamed protein product [Rhizopus stolonifer]